MRGTVAACRCADVRPAGFWEIFVPGIGAGEVYKYEIVGPDGVVLPLKADPYAAQAEHPPRTASVVAAPSHFPWQDGEWLARRGQANDRGSPIAIYEVHLGSWRRNLAEGGRYLSYRELAEQLVPYVADLASPISRSCRSPSTRSTARGLQPVSAVRTDLAPWNARRFPLLCRGLPTAPDSASGSTGCRATSRTIRTGSRGSTAPRSTSTPTRARACTATGVR